MHKIYLTSLSYSPPSPKKSPAQANSNLTTTFAALVNGAALEVRANYFGLCVARNDSNWVCSRNAEGLTDRFAPQQDPLELISINARFKDGIVFSGLMYGISDFFVFRSRINAQMQFSFSLSLRAVIEQFYYIVWCGLRMRNAAGSLLSSLRPLPFALF